MSAGVKIKHVKDVKGPRPKRNVFPLQVDAVFVEAQQLYDQVVSTNCQIKDVKLFHEFLKDRGAYLDNNHKVWLDKIFVEIRDYVRERDIGPLHRTLLMQVVELRARDWNSNGSLESYYRAKIPLTTQLQMHDNECSTSEAGNKEDPVELQVRRPKIVKKNISPPLPLRKLRGMEAGEPHTKRKMDTAEKPAKPEMKNVDESPENDDPILSTNELFRNIMTSKRLDDFREHDNRFRRASSAQSQSSKEAKSQRSNKSHLSDGRSVLAELKINSRMRMDKEEEDRCNKGCSSTTEESAFITFSKANAEVLMMKKVTGFIGLMTNTMIEMVDFQENKPVVLFKIVGKKSNREKAVKYMMGRAGEKALSTPKKAYEERQLEASTKTKPNLAQRVTPLKSQKPFISRAISVDSHGSRPTEYSKAAREVFSAAKIRHNRETLNFQCDLYLPTNCLQEICDKTWTRLEKKSDTRIKINKETSSLQHILVQGPLKSNIRHCLEVLEELVFPDSDESEEEVITKPSLQKTKSWPGHAKFDDLTWSVQQENFSLTSRERGELQFNRGSGTTLQSKIKSRGEMANVETSSLPSTEGNSGASTSAHGDNWENGTEYPQFAFGQEQFQFTSVAVNHAGHNAKASSNYSNQVPCVDIPLPKDSPKVTRSSLMRRAGQGQVRLSEKLVSHAGAETAASVPVRTTAKPAEVQQQLSQEDADDACVWDEKDDDLFMSELASQMENLKVDREVRINQGQTSPFGKYGVMVTIEKHRSKSDSNTRTIGDLEKVVRRCVRTSCPEELSRASSPPRQRFPHILRQRSAEESLRSWRCPPHYTDDSSSTTSAASLSTHPGVQYVRVPVLRQPIHSAMSVELMRKAEEMIPYIGGLGAKKRRTLFRNTAIDRLKAQGIFNFKTGPDIKYDIDALLALASEPASKRSPYSFTDSWPTLVKVYPSVCLEQPWGFNPEDHHSFKDHTLGAN